MYKKYKLKVLTIKSGKKGPKIKKGIIDETNKLIVFIFEYFKVIMKGSLIKIISI